MKREAWVKAGLDPDVILVAQPRSSRNAKHKSIPQTESDLSDVVQLRPEIAQDGEEINPEMPKNVASFSQTEYRPFEGDGEDNSNMSYSQSSNLAETWDNGNIYAYPFQGMDGTGIDDSLDDFNSAMNGYLFDWNEWDMMALPEQL
jgi:hypothetical protein